jgi:hypothetical protein
MMSQKFKAAGIHLGFCLAIAAIVLFLVYYFWYEGVLSAIQNVGHLLLIVLAVDVVLGPFLTFIVYKVGKKSLKFDLAVIAIVQLAFLGYGLSAVYNGRPAFIVFVLDRFETVATVDWPMEERGLASKYAETNLLKPRVVAVRMPTDPDERNKLVLASAGGGADLPQLPKYYVPYENSLEQVIQRAQSIEQLKKLNTSRINEINAILKAIARDESSVGFLPLKGAHDDASVIVDKKTGAVLGSYLFKPW